MMIRCEIFSHLCLLSLLDHSSYNIVLTSVETEKFEGTNAFNKKSGGRAAHPTD